MVTSSLLPLSSRILTAIHWAAGATPVRKVPSTPLSMEVTTMLSPVMPNPCQTASVLMWAMFHSVPRLQAAQLP
jgi:hypothetical protein